MRASFFSVVALAASALAGPISVLQKRQLEQPANIIGALREAVVAETGPINETIASSDGGLLSGVAAAQEINPRLAAITIAIKEATNQVNALQAEKRDLSSVKRQEDGDDGDDDGEVCDAQCLTERVLDVVYEIVSTIRAIIQQFGLANFLSQINPLLLALSALVTSLNILVTGLLVTVTAVVTTLLGGLGLALLLLGWGA